MACLPHSVPAALMFVDNGYLRLFETPVADRGRWHLGVGQAFQTSLAIFSWKARWWEVNAATLDYPDAWVGSPTFNRGLIAL